MEVEEFQYKFGDLVMVGRKPANRYRVVWYIQCEACGGRHVFKKQGTKIWHTSCWLSKTEWTVTPAEYYVQKPADFTKIMGDV